MSRGGIFVHSRQPFPIGTQLRLDLQLLNGTPLIVGEGTVFWTREPDPNKPSTVPGMGIRFSKLSGRSQQVIELVLTQRTGKERSGLFPTLSPTVAVEESGRILNPKSKLPFNVFPGSKSNEDRELLATAGREEATPLVGVSAATMADARPHRDETAASRTPAPAAPIADASSAHSAGTGGAKRSPPALALIKPGAQQAKNPDKAATVEGSGLHRKLTPTGKSATGASRTLSGANAIPPVTTTQEVALPASSIPPAPVQGEPALEASHSALSRPMQSGAFSAVATSAAAISLRPPMTKKLIIGAGALLALGLTIFATTRHPTVSPEVKPNVHTTTATTTAPATATAAQPASGITTGTEPTQAAAGEGNGPAASAETEGTAATAGGKISATNRVVADRRGAKTKAAPAHRGPEPQAAAHGSSPTLEKPPVAEAPPRVEPPAPAPPPLPPAPIAVAHAEPPAAPRSIVSTAPPPVAAIAHKLRMTSIPSEAEVEIDGKVVGKTPLFGVEIDATRPHMLVVRKDGFSPFKQTISGSSEWSVRPSENTATLRISALMKKL